MTDDLLARHRAVLPAWMPLYYGDEPLEIVSGSDRRVTDATGRSYQDLFGGVLTNMIGYAVAEGAPTTQPLFYGGLVTSKDGTPLEGTAALDPFEFVRTIACARITMPKAVVRLSAGRQEMSDGIQALCFFAGANSIFYGEKLLTTGNPEASRDDALLQALGIGRA